MYDLLCEYFSPDAVEGIFILLLAMPLIGWRIAVAMEGKAVPGFWKAHVQSLGRVGISLGICCVLFFAYSTQKDEQQQAQQQVVVELFTSISEALGSLGETILRNYLTPEEKKSRLLPVGLATNATAWVAESQCVTSQVREAWQRVPIRRAAFRQTLPFPVSIGGNSFNEVFISSSGVIGFDAPKGSEITREMPYEEAADHVYLALLWGRIDFKPRLGSKMWCGVKEDGNFVASYDTVFIDGDTNAVAKVQVEFIANGDMILRYSDLPPCSTNAHVAGFQNLDGGWTLPFDNIRSNSAIYLKSFGQLDLTVEDSDTDVDGISDYYELYPTNSISLTDPCNRDSDGDGLMDGEEVSLYATDPGAFSSDASGTGDLWRVLGGLGPSDAPYTNATPSGSLGILTVTTVLEGGTTNGGAVLRIADQYIPVLFGTTLVSRIAVPRDATNLFILARGANCDDAIAHVTVEASTFTKIRDPSGVFGWSFTLSPSCVTASGTILMPSYTITPDVVCFHCPTSSVCRITSADPDIYFVTTQGLVREYTPPTPEMQTNSFSIGAVQIQLACMNMALSTRASVTNIPCHLCNPDSGADDEYPDGEYYSTWCKFVNGVHVWADGYGPTNCPCLPAFTNAFECICSGDGRNPCTCAHAVSDPKAMPLNADQTNVLGHAALVIGGTNDLLQVTVPEGTYRPCPLCACARGEPSSASVYRQTSCIEVTPGSLTTNGAFSVAGISPSTNFADTVFMYKITDYSSAQAVTSYTRKDYTVIGTSVYPTDPGHTVSNWFVRCDVTNQLTLKTDVLLTTGEVSLALTGEAKIAIFNRVAMTNDLLLTPDSTVFTMGITEWRDMYCDTNGLSCAYLYVRGTDPDIGRVTFSFEAPYEGGSVSCSSQQPFNPYMITFEPVTTTNAPDFYNPSGVATGGTAWYTISVEPASRFPSNTITWCVAYGDLTFVNDNNKGRFIGIQAGNTTNDFRLDVTVEGLDLDPVPTIITHILEPKTVPVKAWIVANDNGTLVATTPEAVTYMIAEANRFLSQMAMTLVLNGPICVTNRTEWLEIENVNGFYPETTDLCVLESATGGLEMYFVNTIDDGMTLGLNTLGGMLIATNTTGRTLAHEVGHACGLEDIFMSFQIQTNLVVEGHVNQERIPGDWGGGFYSRESTQAAVLTRLLMYGVDYEASFDQGDITSGKTYGVGYHYITNSIVWSLDMFKTGFDGMKPRPPEHL